MTISTNSSFSNNNHTQVEKTRIRVALLQSKLLQSLSSNVLEDLSNRVSIVKFASNQTVVTKGDEGDRLFIVITGRVKVVLYGENGREVTLSILRQGESFGEMSLFDTKPRSANCITSEKTEVLSLSRADLIAHIQRYPETAMNLLGELGRRLRKADQAIAGLALCDVNERLIQRLVSLAIEEGTNVEEGLLVKKRPTQQELANMVGSCRETISRAFNQLVKEGLVIARGRQMIVTPSLLSKFNKAA